MAVNPFIPRPVDQSARAAIRKQNRLGTLNQRSPEFLVPGTSFVKDNVSTDWRGVGGGGWAGIVSG